MCRTKKHEKLGGFSDHTARPKPKLKEGNIEAFSPNEDKYTVKPEEYAALALIGFGEGHEDLKVQMMARACYPEIKISRQVV